MVFVCGPKMMWGSIDFVVVWVAEIYWVFVCGPIFFFFRVSIELHFNFVFVWAVEMDLISMWGVQPVLISV